MKRAPLLILLLASSAHAGVGADEHMLAGAQAFRAGHFAEALVEFRVAERMGSDGGTIWYVAATLVKLDRPDDALTEFARAQAYASGERDTLFDYYHALACYDARLYFCADRLLSPLGQQPGTGIPAQARKIRADLAPIISGAPRPTPATIDWYHVRAAAALAAGRAALAEAYYDEAARLAALRPDGYRRAEALTGSTRAAQTERSP